MTRQHIIIQLHNGQIIPNLDLLLIIETSHLFIVPIQGILYLYSKSLTSFVEKPVYSVYSLYICLVFHYVIPLHLLFNRKFITDLVGAQQLRTRDQLSLRLPDTRVILPLGLESNIYSDLSTFEINIF